jgi:hypothetical protein
VAVASELERLVSAGAQRFYLGHGGPLEAREDCNMRNSCHARHRFQLGHATAIIGQAEKGINNHVPGLHCFPSGKEPDALYDSG